jgi:hypothetical protein
LAERPILLFRNSFRLKDRLVGVPLGFARFFNLLLSKGKGCRTPQSRQSRTHHRNRAHSHVCVLDFWQAEQLLWPFVVSETDFRLWGG